MHRSPADVQLAQETLAAAAADPAIAEFDVRDFEGIQRWTSGSDERWLTAAALFFDFRVRRRTGGEGARDEFLRAMGL